MTSLTPLVESNLALLEQARGLVARLSDASYAVQRDRGRAGGVGAHLRHVLDHFESFLSGLPEGRVDYDARARDPRVESERSAALASLQRCTGRLARISADEPEGGVRVAVDCGGDLADRRWGPSSVARELQFLASHTIHHFALIAVDLRSRGLEPGPNFGVAPSTLRWEAKQGLSVGP